MLRLLPGRLQRHLKSSLRVGCRAGPLAAAFGSIGGQSISAGTRESLSFESSRLTGRRSFHVLGIETSCDDSAIAIVNSETNEVVFQRLASQWAEHAPHGGIVPSLAVRAHDKNVPVLLQDMKDKGFAGLIDAIAVTRGPGIKPCLSIGLSAAQKLARELGKPLIMVNHLQGHALVALLESDGTPVNNASFSSSSSSAARVGTGVENTPTSSDCSTASSVTDDDDKDDDKDDDTAALKYPFLSLVVSGGHSLLVLVEAYDSFRLLGSTLDDSVGEAFDKVARLLQLATPQAPENDISNDCAGNQERRRESPAVVARHGGALVEAAAAKSQNHAHFSLPVPLARRQDCDFSFAGLKTAVRYALIREHRASSQQSEQYSSPAPDTAAVTAASSDVLEVPGDCNTVGQESGRGGVEKGNMQARKSLNDFKGMKGVSTVPVSPSAAADMAWAFQNAATKHLQKRLDRAIQWLAAGKTMGAPGSRNPELVDAEPVTIRHVVVCGGVASNQHIRKELTETVEAHGLRAVFPPPPLCVDNGVMIAFAAVEHIRNNPHVLQDESGVSHAYPDPRGRDSAVKPLARWLFPR